jgi:hypothetical protein
VKRAFVASLVVAGLMVAPVMAQQAMPDPKAISGVPLPAGDLPAGTLSVLVVRGGFDKPIAGQAVTVSVDGKATVQKTDAAGRLQVTTLKPGAHVKAVATVDGERLESQDVVMAGTGIKLVLVATDPEATKRAEEDARLAAGPAVKGTVVLGPESRILAEFVDDQLNVFYSIDILNTARTPVDIGGPIAIDLPSEARGAALVDGSSKQAAVSGAHLTVLGPFAPGTTSLTVAFELPFGGGTARIDQVWPVTLQQVNVMVPQTGTLDLRSPQIAAKKLVADQGPAVITGVGPALPAGQPLQLEISGLPHHAAWPRYVALTFATGIMAVGIWAAVFPAPRRRTA